uniref:Uncharacterized protein n=1 Tax=Mycena chlorophos TaxID=658473 RepID=A0ABQ0LUS0_MYCCL|nr:predicted protein [Mycena chlorophos]
MALPFGPQAAHHKASIVEGLRIVRTVFARDAGRNSLTTKDVFRLALREQPSPEFVLSVGTGKNAPWRQGNLPLLPGRKLGPQPSRPTHPIRSLSFLKHHILPILHGEKAVRHVQETRGVYESQKKKLLASTTTSTEPTTAPTATAIQSKKDKDLGGKLLWVWRASRSSRSRFTRTAKPQRPYVYDYSHMKPAKRRAHKGYHAFIAKRDMLRERAAKLRKEAKRQAEAPMREEMRAKAREAHLQAERDGAIKRAERKKRWVKQNPVLASMVAKQERLAQAQTKATQQQRPRKHTN